MGTWSLIVTLLITSAASLDERCNVPTVVNGKFKRGEYAIPSGGRINSSEIMKLECNTGYELYEELASEYLGSEQKDIKCYKGSFNPRIPICKPKRCKMDRSRRLLPDNQTYFEHGTLLTVSCDRKMELSRLGAYFDEQETAVLCSNGAWIPDLLECINKSCKLPDLQEGVNGYNFSGNETKPDEFLPHNLWMVTVCKEGYRQRGVQTCIAGIWEGNATCDLELCDRPDFEYIILNQGIPTNNNGSFSHGTKINASCESSSRMYDDDYRLAENATTECIHGEWKPKLRCKSKHVFIQKDCF